MISTPGRAPNQSESSSWFVSSTTRRGNEPRWASRNKEKGGLDNDGRHHQLGVDANRLFIPFSLSLYASRKFTHTCNAHQNVLFRDACYFPLRRLSEGYISFGTIT